MDHSAQAIIGAQIW